MAEHGRPSIAVPATLLAAPGDEIALAVEIAGIELLPQKAFLRLRGLPGGATLSEGHLVTPGVWAVPLASLGSLRVRVPVDVAGKASLHLSLVTIDGSVLAEANAALLVAPAVDAATVPPAPTPKKRESGPVPHAVPPLPVLKAPPEPAHRPAGAAAPPAKADPDAEALKRALSSKARGEKALAQGSIADARMLLTHAAEHGIAEAALLLGSTYDPFELKRLGTIGIAPEPERARHWYAIARQLGSPNAAARLKRLEGR